MSAILNLAQVAAGVNVLLLLALCYVWGRNYHQIRSQHTLGALVFALFLLAENALALYYYLYGPAMPPPAIRAMMYLQVLETVGIAFLTYVTWR
jgi:hypothetical protein